MVGLSLDGPNPLSLGSKTPITRLAHCQSVGTHQLDSLNLGKSTFGIVINDDVLHA